MLMSESLMYLGWVSLFTALLWLPYILNMILVRGLIDAVGYPANPKPLAPWAERMKAAHYNAVENLVVFAPLVVLANMFGAADGTTATAALVYLIARVVHFVVYAMAIPWLRTISFTVGWVCTVMVAGQVLF